MSRSTAALSIAHPAIIKTPPNGVIGPRKRNLVTIPEFQPPIDEGREQRDAPSLERGHCKDRAGEQDRAPKNSWPSKLVGGKPIVLGNGQQRNSIEALHRPEGHSQLSVKSGDLRTMYSAAVTQLATLSAVIPGLLFKPCAPKAAAENPMAAER